MSTISVLQWNILFEEDIRKIIAFLQAHPSDIVCLQELTCDYPYMSADTARLVAEALGYQYHTQNFPFIHDDWTLANGIFTAMPILEKKTVWITAAANAPKRPYIEVTIQVGDTEFTIGTTHMSYTKAFQNTPQKEQEAVHLAEILHTKKQRYIFTGDLNATPDSPTVRRVAAALKHSGPDFSQPTWTTKPFSYDGFSAQELAWRLDYIFTTQDMQVAAAEILQTDLSDHLPVRVELVVPD